MSHRYRHGMNWIRQEKRLALYMRDNFACVYCGLGIEELDVPLSLDHVIHRGGNDPSNLVTACYNCNSVKKNLKLEKFLSLEMSDRRAALAARRVERALRKPWKHLLPEARKIIAERKLRREQPF